MNHKPPPDEPEELLEDLEDLHDFLEEEETPDHNDVDEESSAAVAADAPDELPLLQEQVVAESRFSDQTINTLLGDAWQEAADKLLQDARDTIGSHSTIWQPEDTDELNHALKIRIDETVRAWLGEVLKAHIHVLHQHIVRELADELQTQINKKIYAEAANEPGGTDGKDS